MRIINLKGVQAIDGRLLEQIYFLKKILEELEQTECLVREMSFTRKTVQLLNKGKKEIEEEIQTLQQMVGCLQSVREIYTETEQRIADMYDMERIVYPKAVFGRSTITGLDGLEELLPF